MDADNSKAKPPNRIDRHVGARIRARRMAIGLSQEWLGEALGVTVQQIQECEKGLNRVGAGRLATAARILGVPIAYFFDGLDAGGSGEPDSHARLAEALFGTAEGIRLARAFISLEHAAVRRKAVELIEALSQARQV